MDKRKLKTLTPTQKVDLIQAVEDNEKTRQKTKLQIAKEFEIAPSTLSTILKSKDTILERFAAGDNRKRKREMDYPDVDEAVLRFFKQARAENISVPGPVLQGKAEYFAKELGYEKFHASNGWMEKFKSRHEIVFKKVCGESNAVDDQVCEDWLRKLQLHCTGYQPEDIFNADETALFFKCMPDKTMSFKNENCHGGKQSKERITLLFAANSTGTEKLKILVIGKSKKPQCFRGVKSLPVDYYANQTAWMNTQIFCEWLNKLNKKMKKDKRKILLFIDNCTAHTCFPQLSNIKIQFLPANTTSKLQPLDQGIIRNFKCIYRKEVVCRMLSDMEKKVATKITVLDAIRMATKSWKNVSPTTIANCFKKSGFSVEFNDLQENLVLKLNTQPSSEQWEAINRHLGMQDTISFEEFVDIDLHVPTDAKLTDEEIINSVIETSGEENDVDDDNNEADNVELLVETVSLNQAKKMIEQLKSFFEKCDNTPDAIFDNLINIDNAIDCERIKGARQSKLDEFFTKTF